MRFPFGIRPERSRWDDDDNAEEPPPPLVQPEPVNPDFFDPGWSDWDEEDKKPARRWFIGLSVAAVLVIGFVLFKPTLTKTLHSSTSTSTTIIKVSVVPKVFSIKEGANQAQSVTFSGEKPTSATAAFTAPAGLAVLSYRCNCNGQFSVTVIDTTGSPAAIPVNLTTPGVVAGTVPMSLPAGTYTAALAGTGKWSISISYPSKSPAVSIPLNEALIGPEVVGPFSGTQAVSVTYGAYFAPSQIVSIHTMDEQGKLGPEVLSSPAQGGKTVSISAQGSPYYLAVSDAPPVWFLRVVGTS